MSTWWIIEEKMIIADELTRRQVKALRPVTGNKTREEALVELCKVAKSYIPHSLRSVSRLVGRDSDGSFWILPKNGKKLASSNLRLIEQVAP